jgi:hypothetical protein
VRRAAGRLALAAVALLAAPALSAAGEESPWPEHGTARDHLRVAGKVVRQLEDEVSLMELSAARYARWEACIRGLPVSEYGDHDGRFGFVYDERDGTGPGYMPALAVDRRSRKGREDYLFFAFARRGDCRSAAPLPGGTADPASVATVGGLERRARRLQRAVHRLEAAAERFDAWESCVSWVPVTEHGDPDGRYGYRFERPNTPPRFRTAIAVDRSDWDDPDYMLLAFVGGDRPGGTCRDEPGEGVD